MRRLFGHPLALVLTLVLVLGTTLAARAQAPAVLRIDSAEVATGATEEIPLVLDGASGIVAMHVEITYDSAALEFDSLESGDLLEGALVETNADNPGRIIVGFATLDEVAGDGSLLLPKFQVTGEDGATTAIGLENVRAWDANGFDILVEVRDAQLTITSAGGLPLWIVALAALLAVVVVAAIVLRQRGRGGPQPATVGAGAAEAVAAAAPQPAQSTPAGATTSPQLPGELKEAEGARFCSHCGAVSEAGTRFCAKCGAEAR